MRLIDANELKIDYGFTYDDITPTHEEMYALIDRQPTIDAVPAVRCENCKCKDMYENFCRRFLREIDPSDFCSMAERRTDE